MKFGELSGQGTLIGLAGFWTPLEQCRGQSGLALLVERPLGHCGGKGLLARQWVGAWGGQCTTLEQRSFGERQPHFEIVALSLTQFDESAEETAVLDRSSGAIRKKHLLSLARASFCLQRQRYSILRSL